MRNVVWVRRTLLRLALGSALAGLLAAASPAQPPPLRHRTRLRRRRQPMVVIDPGHGGIDPGAIGAGGVYEKFITFATAADLARVLKATGRFRATLTRGRDEYVALRERVARARALHADLFLSIHADALPNSAMRGLSVFTLSAAASDREAAALAVSENRDIIAVARRRREVDAILIDLTRRETDNQSLELARAVVEALGREVILLENPQRAAGFVVLTAADIPSVLVELGCLSNAVEERLLIQRSYQWRLAHSLARAIETYFEKAGSY
jgi:N-acetylmuramoyl-L-alanine amidase